jgi:hypothetical protein
MSLYKHASLESTQVVPFKSLYDKILFGVVSYAIFTILYNFYVIGDDFIHYQKYIVGYTIGVASLILLILSIIKKKVIYFLLLAILYAICALNVMYTNTSPDGTPYHDAAIFWADPNRFLVLLYFIDIDIDSPRLWKYLEFWTPTLIFTFFFFKERSNEKKLLSSDSNF